MRFAALPLFALGILVGAASAATALPVIVELQNVLIDSDPSYAVTGSFLFDPSVGPYPPFPPYSWGGYSNFNITAKTPYGTFLMNNLWTANAGDWTYLGLSADPGGVGTSLIFIYANDLRQSVLNMQPDPLLPLGSGSNYIPGGSALAPSVAELYDDPQVQLYSVSGSFVPSGTVPEPSTWALMLIGFASLGLWIPTTLHGAALRGRRHGLRG